MFKELENLLARKNQRFLCRHGWLEPSPSEYIIHIKHEATPPLDSTALNILRDQVGNLPDIISFYSRYGSLRLYSDSMNETFAFYIASPENWPELKDDFKIWIDDLSENEKTEMLPDWISNYAVIGKVPSASDYFLLPLIGESRGKIFEFEHDGFEFIERGASFAEFIAHLSTANESLINEIRGNTRYSDSRPESQWLIEEYFYDE